MEKIVIRGDKLNLEDIARVAKGLCFVELEESLDLTVADVEDVIEDSDSESAKRILRKDFIKDRNFKGIKLTKADLSRLQKNLLRTYASDFEGEMLSAEQGRAAMLMVLNRAISSANFSRKTVRAIVALLNLGVAPIVSIDFACNFETQSLAAAQMFLPLIGEGRVFFEEKIVKTEFFINRSSFEAVDLANSESEILLGDCYLLRGVLALEILAAKNVLEHLEDILLMKLEVLRLVPSEKFATILADSGIPSRLRLDGDSSFVDQALRSKEAMDEALQFLEKNLWSENLDLSLFDSAALNYAEQMLQRVNALLTVGTLDLPAGLNKNEAGVGLMPLLDLARHNFKQIPQSDFSKTVRLLEKLLAIELICLSQAVDLMRPLKSAGRVERMHSRVRHYISPHKNDRNLSSDLQRLQGLLATGKLFDKE